MGKFTISMAMASIAILTSPEGTLFHGQSIYKWMIPEVSTAWWLGGLQKWDEELMTSVPVPSGKRLHNYGKSQFLMGKLTISMAMFNSYVKLPEGMSFRSGDEPYIMGGIKY